MKVLAIFLIVAIAGHFAHAADLHHLPDVEVQKIAGRLFGHEVTAALDKFKEVMKKGDESLGVPKLDPFDKKYQEINIDNDLATVEGNLRNVHVEGLSDFTVQHADFNFNKRNLELDLLWSNIKGYMSYDINAMVLNQFQVFGKGDFKFDLGNFNFATTFKLNIDFKNDKISIVSLNETKIALENLKVEITGLFNDEKLSQEISTVISEMGPGFIKNAQDEITARVNTYIVQYGNEILENVDVWGFIGL